MALRRAALPLLLLLLLPVGLTAAEQVVEASGDGEAADAVVDSGVEQDMVGEELMRFEPSADPGPGPGPEPEPEPEPVSASDAAQREDLATRPKQAKKTEEATREQELRPQPRPTSATGLIANLFSSLARPEEGSQCPGRCYHALAALMCEKVLDDKPCPQPSMRCCVLAGGQQAPAPATVAPPAPAALTATKSATTKREVPTTPATTTTPAPTTTPTTRAPAPETTTATSPTID
ncbi:protein masquerade-like [Pollicipes pollicipes]|uniref:protein masquerade-like n=1 Tax=Pollicipes pollicipes TaxID=41117 RepID=UPI0018850770|nr:protein masquerade-like [Pollicipes pollicipes]